MGPPFEDNAGSIRIETKSGTGYPAGEDGLSAMEILMAAYQSAEQDGMTVDLRHANLQRDKKYPWA